eukprot:1158101-Pelagomonas_calceolata.AAC.1
MSPCSWEGSVPLCAGAVSDPSNIGIHDMDPHLLVRTTATVLAGSSGRQEVEGSPDTLQAGRWPIMLSHSVLLQP